MAAHWARDPVTGYYQAMLSQSGGHGHHFRQGVHGVLRDVYCDPCLQVMDNMHAQLDEAIESLENLTLDETEVWEDPPMPNLTVGEITDPAVGTEARYTLQWEQWLKSPKVGVYTPAITPHAQTPWWGNNRTHYGLLQPQEQARLERPAFAAQFARDGTYPPGRSRFAQQVRSPRPRSPLPMSRPVRYARSCSQDIYDDPEYEPEFWARNLRPGNIWTDPPRFPVRDQDNVSPRTVLEPQAHNWNRGVSQIGRSGQSFYQPVYQAVSGRRENLNSLMNWDQYQSTPYFLYY
ncbi:hypothetical protein N656DRAFT_84025 [Canariomyces notabilis]|uniref:Uncharacterized protein n=1 Tax=Canariomyces notabilis TaxID=2074819 RepID=A0AAN6YSZ0_9PEZI|nr:hypothetical protein N656DRAFT_84025 [Canariomyces arenarius]